MKREAQALNATTVTQALSNLKTQIANLSNLDVASLPNQLQSLTEAVEQIELQVGQLEQMRAQMQQQLQQTSQTSQADDADDDDLSKLIHEPNKPQALPMPPTFNPSGPAIVPQQDWFKSRTMAPSGPAKKSSSADKKKRKKKEHPTPRDKEHNKELPDFWRKNYDYGESPYMHLDEIEKITDKPPFSKRQKKDKKSK